MGRTLLVTGGAGFIGANFVYHWMRTRPNDRVVVLDALTYAGNLDNLDELRADVRFAFHPGRIEDRSALSLRRLAFGPGGVPDKVGNCVTG